MPTERWVLVGVPSAKDEEALRRAISQAGFRTTRAHTVEDCAALMQRRVFLCMFLDTRLYRSLAKRNLFRSPTYTVLVLNAREKEPRTNGQALADVQDWVKSPVDGSSVPAILNRARTHVRMAEELEAVKSTAWDAIHRDATLLCTGSWAESANRWLERARRREDPILLAGEAGSGKGLLARLLHYSSPRATAPFVTVRCQDRAPGELEREIFGEIPPRERPTHTLPLRSKFSLAANGTVLFDKAEHLPRALQQRVARAIRNCRFSPIGGGDMLELHARLIFTVQEKTSGKNLIKLFHRDLARLLKGSSLRIPPLRERPQDLPEIAQTALRKIRREHGARPGGITDKAMALIQRHAWPGNIRELEGILWAASQVAQRGNISLKTLTPFLSNGAKAIRDEESALEEIVEERLNALFHRFGVEHLKDLHQMMLEGLEKPLFQLVLQKTRGNQVRAASLLGINRNTLRRKLTYYGIQV